MAIAQVQKKQTSTTGTTSHAFTFTSTPTDSNLLVFVVTFTTDPGTITPEAGIDVAVAAQRGTAQTIGIYYTVASGEDTSFTFTTANSVNGRCEAYEYSGCDATQASVLDVFTSNDGGAGTVTSLSTGTTGTTAQADELAITGVGLSGSSGGSEAWTNSFTLETGTGVPNSASKILSATGTQESTASWATARTAVAAIATFKAGGAGSQAITPTGPTVTVTPGTATVTGGAVVTPGKLGY